jgi:glycosyltransferase involved in cell wall biosynthesis/ubiquinone/menaquinone biosynthesis C-methylase UbiE
MAQPRRASISVALPVYNERRTIREIIRRVKAVDREKEILIVDDASTDGTRRILREYEGDPEVRLFFQPQNAGKGMALQRAFEAATKDVVIIQDADLEYCPTDFERLLRPIDDGLADVVYGSRFLDGDRRVLYFWHAVGNRVLTCLSNALTNLNLTDMETCYKVFKRQIIQNIRLSSRRFGFEPEITAKLAKLPCTIYEVPISYHGRTYAQGKKISWKDGVAALGHILRYSLNRGDYVKDRDAIERVLVNPPDKEDTGLLTLEAFEVARRYNHWLAQRFQPHFGKRVLEIGSGIGNIIAEVLAHPEPEQVVATDLSPLKLEVLRDRLGDDPRLSCVPWDVNDPIPEGLTPGSIDTLICSNVLEHIENDRGALGRMHQLLAPGGKLVLLVPAHQALYSGLDEDLGHFRRYTQASLKPLLEQCGFKVADLFEHNFVGALGWFWSGKVRRRRHLQMKDVRRFDRLVPFLKPIDGILTRLFGGVSVIAVAEKVEGAAPPVESREDQHVGLEATARREEAREKDLVAAETSYAPEASATADRR